MNITQWNPQTSPSKDMYDTLPIWVTFLSIKKEYQCDEVVSRIASTLGTLLFGHFADGCNNNLDAHVLVVVGASFCFPHFTNILIEGGSGEVYDSIIMNIRSSLNM